MRSTVEGQCHRVSWWRTELVAVVRRAWWVVLPGMVGCSRGRVDLCCGVNRGGPVGMSFVRERWIRRE